MKGSAAAACFLALAGPEPPDPARPPGRGLPEKDPPARGLAPLEAGILQIDSDGDGVHDPDDCRPLDNTLWYVPSPAQDPAIAGGASASLTWSAPATPGGTVVFYDLLMSGSGGSWSPCSCLEPNTLSQSGTCSAMPSPGQVLYYVARSKNACGENMGQTSGGAPRTGAACGTFPKPDGDPCTAGPECNSGYCVDGFCCESACEGVCEHCGQPGRQGYCDPVPQGADPDGECPTGVPPDLYCITGYCNGLGACEPYPPGHRCSVSTCNGTYQELPDECDGSGTCVNQGALNCAPYNCFCGAPDGGQGCCTSCISQQQCAPGASCNLSTNQCGYPDGYPCSGHDQCYNGACCADIYARITLTPPSGADYDLFVYRPCGTLIGSSQNGGSAIDQVTISGNDDCLAGDDGYTYYVEVRYYSGSTCSSWSLRFQGRDC